MSIRVRTLKRPDRRQCDGCGKKPSIQVVATTMLQNEDAHAVAVDLCPKCAQRLKQELS